MMSRTAILDLWRDRFRVRTRQATVAFNRLAPRERKLVVVGGAVALAALTYLFGIEPAMQSIARDRAALPALRVQAATVEALTRDVARLRQSANHVASEAALTRDDIVASLAASGMSADTWTVLDADDASANWSVAFKQVPADTLFAWLQRTPLTLRATAQTASLQRSTMSTGRLLSGKADGTVTLTPVKPKNAP
ncbi:type II secretion system protein GspM [Schauerella aestuarii]|uniref:type II secretion system protein GspM n=1 Tax=Schauerella aestuarii TaxID=2511204 RepID=UPI001369C65D|nr:type II secretion system protein GspM [Achromobacter aestuarii]MYZ43387.1 hypothetical protein [Achromobacter aestuarii]